MTKPTLIKKLRMVDKSRILCRRQRERRGTEPEGDTNMPDAMTG